MKTYTLYEMVGLLRLGVWQGGMVEKLDYIGSAVCEQTDAVDCGWRGVYITVNAMMESCEVSDSGAGCTLRISLYDPYSGTFEIYSLETSVSGREWLASKIEDIAMGRREDYIWSHNIYKNNIYNIERRHTAQHSSMRSGSIDGPRQSKRFKR